MKEKGQIATILTLIAMGLMSLGIFAGTVVITNPASPFYIKAEPNCLSIELVDGSPDGWENPEYKDNYTVEARVCLGSAATETNTSAWMLNYDSQYMFSASGGWGLPGRLDTANPCRNVTLGFNMENAWKGSPVAKATFIVTSRNVGDWGCYTDLKKTLTFGTAAPTPTATPSVTATPTLTPPPAATNTPTPTTTPTSTVTPTLTPTLTPIPECPRTCDVNGDGAENEADFNKMQSCWQQPLTCCPACDFDCDGLLNITDAQLLLVYCPHTAPITKTPTPTPTLTPTPTVNPNCRCDQDPNNPRIEICQGGCGNREGHQCSSGDPVNGDNYCRGVTPIPTATPMPTATPTVTPTPTGCYFKATVDVYENTMNGPLINEAFKVVNNKGQGFDFTGTNTYETTNLPENDRNTFVANTLKRNDVALSTSTSPWKIVGSFCSAQDSNPADAGHCPSNAGQPVNPLGEPNSNDGFKIACGAVYSYGWILTRTIPEPTPQPGGGYVYGRVIDEAGKFWTTWDACRAGRQCGGECGNIDVTNRNYWDCNPQPYFATHAFDTNRYQTITLTPPPGSNCVRWHVDYWEQGGGLFYSKEGPGCSANIVILPGERTTFAFTITVPVVSGGCAGINCYWCTDEARCNSEGWNWVPDVPAYCSDPTHNWCQKPGCCGGAAPTTPPASCATQTTCSSTTCMYSEDHGGGNIDCHEGNCCDGTNICGFNSNCGYVPGCSTGASVACLGQPTFTPAPGTPTPTPRPGATSTPTPTPTLIPSPTRVPNTPTPAPPYSGCTDWGTPEDCFPHCEAGKICLDSNAQPPGRFCCPFPTPTQCQNKGSYSTCASTCPSGWFCLTYDGQPNGPYCCPPNVYPGSTPTPTPTPICSSPVGYNCTPLGDCNTAYNCSSGYCDQYDCCCTLAPTNTPTPTPTPTVTPIPTDIPFFAPQADVNEDGSVDEEDARVVIQNYHTTGVAGEVTGDASGDGRVDARDLSLVITYASE